MTDKLLDDIKASIVDMQSRMQNTYASLADIKLIGESRDKSLRIIMTATYAFEDIEMDERALQGGVKEFKWRLREAWKSLSEQIQKTTQNKTMELLTSMQIPDEIRNLSVTDQTEGDEGEGGQGRIGG